MSDPDPVPAPSASPSTVLVVSSWLPDGVDEEFGRWCDAHHRGLLTVPGVRRARRFHRRSGSGSDAPDLLVTYELDDPAIARGDLWRERGAAPGPLPAGIAEGLRSTSRPMRVAGAVPATWWPPTPSTLLDVFALSDARRVDVLVQGMSTVVATDGAVTVRVLRADESPALVLIDHREEDGHDLIEALTDASGANRSRWTVVFDETPDGGAATGS